MTRCFLSTATAVATIAAAAALPSRAQDAGAQDQTQDQDVQAQDTRQGDAAKDKIDITTWNYGDLYKGWSAENFLDADVYDEDGEEIGEVEDLIVTPEGQVKDLVIEAGGFLDIGDTHFAYPWDEAKVEGPDRVQVSFDEDNVESYSLFGDIEGEPVGPRNWRITELIDDYARLGDRGYGWVDDAVISPKGQVEAVVVTRDVAYGPGGPYAWPYYGYPYGFDPGLNYYAVPYTEDEIAHLEPFDIDRLNDGAVAEVDDDQGADQDQEQNTTE